MQSLSEQTEAQVVAAITPEAFRRLFPSLRQMSHFASCSFAPLSTAATAAAAHLGDLLATGEPPWAYYESELSRCRELFAALIGTSAAHVAVQPNASTAAAQAASTLDWTRRGVALACDAEFPSLVHVWRSMATEVRIVPSAADGSIPVAAYLEAIDSDTVLVSVPLVAYRSGARVSPADVAAITARAHEVGARVVVDAYQALGVLPVDVAELRCDFLVGGAMKYLLGQPGVAWLFAREPAAGQPPMVTGWFAQDDPLAFDIGPSRLAGDARRFETGTPAFPAICVANVGLELVADVGPERIWAHVQRIVDLLDTQLAAAGHAVGSPRDAMLRGPMVALRHPDPASAAGLLHERGVVASPRGDVVRLAAHYFTTEDDVGVVLEALAGQP